MKLNEIRMIIKSKDDLFETNQIEKLIHELPFEQKEFHVSKMNKLAILKLETEQEVLVIVLEAKSIQIRMKALTALPVCNVIMEVLSGYTEAPMSAERIVFLGSAASQSESIAYNELFKNELPDSFQVKMLGIDIDTDDYRYKVSLNKKEEEIKVTANAFIKNSVEDICVEIEAAYNQLEQKLSEWFNLCK